MSDCWLHPAGRIRPDPYNHAQGRRGRPTSRPRLTAPATVSSLHRRHDMHGNRVRERRGRGGGQEGRPRLAGQVLRKGQAADDHVYGAQGRNGLPGRRQGLHDIQGGLDKSAEFCRDGSEERLLLSHDPLERVRYLTHHYYFSEGKALRNAAGLMGGPWEVLPTEAVK